MASKIAAAIQKTVRPIRVGVVAMGLDVQHAHFHLVPLHSRFDITSKAELEGRLTTPTPTERDAMADAIRRNLDD